MKLKRNVVLLATNQRANLAFNQINSRLLYDVDSTINRVLPSCTYQHLYITSDEEIKKGDWYIDDTNAVRQAVTSDDIYWKSRTDYKKIIATTDKTLTFDDAFNSWFLPSPSNGFIKKFIERYNAGNPITEVMVEYEEHIKSACECDTMEKLYNCKHSCGENCTKRFPDGEFWHKWQTLKVDKNNCITITAVKDSWTREEVIAILHSYLDSFSTKHENFHKILEDQMNEWIEQNL